MEKNLGNQKQFNKMYYFALIFLVIFVLGELAFVFATIGNSKLEKDLKKQNPIIATGIDPKTGCKKEWNFYESSRFGYKICYPSVWHATFYNEEDKTLLYGTHSIFSYNYKNASNYSKKGVLNWKEFVGNEPQVKFDIDVPSAINSDAKIENTELKMIEFDKITGQSFWNVQKQVGNNIVSFNILAANYSDLDLLQKSKNWQLLLETIATLK